MVGGCILGFGLFERLTKLVEEASCDTWFAEGHLAFIIEECKLAFIFPYYSDRSINDLETMTEFVCDKPSSTI